ncbi:hypothetical protein P8452_42463 [Trifolium repens]|nr:hypothetical protein P8452_42463 [Trifolium repens]
MVVQMFLNVEGKTEILTPESLPRSWGLLVLVKELLPHLGSYLTASGVLSGSDVLNARPGSANSSVNVVRFNSYCRPESCINIMAL